MERDQSQRPPSAQSQWQVVLDRPLNTLNTLVIDSVFSLRHFKCNCQSRYASLFFFIPAFVFSFSFFLFFFLLCFCFCPPHFFFFFFFFLFPFVFSSLLFFFFLFLILKFLFEVFPLKSINVLLFDFIFSFFFFCYSFFSGHHHNQSQPVITFQSQPVFIITSPNPLHLRSSHTSILFSPRRSVSFFFSLVLSVGLFVFEPWATMALLALYSTTALGDQWQDSPDMTTLIPSSLPSSVAPT